jgi:hypothetical protein
LVHDNEVLSEEQVKWLQEVAVAFSETTLNHSNIFTPSLLNQNLINLNNNPETPNYDKLVKALENAKSNGEKLRGFQEWMELAEITFKRLLEYYANILSFDLSYTCINVKDKKEFGTAKYKKDKQKVEDFLTHFNYKKEFLKTVRQMMRTETAFYWLRNNGDINKPEYTLQLMPQRYCLITGAWEKGFLYDFDMNYFLQPGVDINGYDPVFKEFMATMYGGGGVHKNYNPSNSFNKRNGMFAYWTQTSPIYMHNNLPSGAWVFKLDDSSFNDVPFLSSLMRDAILNIPVKKLQYDKDALGAYAYLIGEIKMLKSNEANATAFDPVRLGTLLQIVKQAIGKHIVVGAMPAEENKWYQYKDENTSMAETQVKTTLASGAGASRILYSSDKMSQEEIRNAILADYNVMRKVYTQFNNFLDFYVNQLTKHYKFKFAFDGSVYGFEREWRKDGIMKLAQTGIVLNDTAFASAFGYDPVMFSHMLFETSAEDSWLKNRSSLQSIFTTPGVANGGSNDQQRGGNASNYNQEGTNYIHTGRPGRPRKADSSTDSSDYDAHTT